MLQKKTFHKKWDKIRRLRILTKNRMSWAQLAEHVWKSKSRLNQIEKNSETCKISSEDLLIFSKVFSIPLENFSQDKPLYFYVSDTNLNPKTVSAKATPKNKITFAYTDIEAMVHEMSMEFIKNKPNAIGRMITKLKSLFARWGIHIEIAQKWVVGKDEGTRSSYTMATKPSNG